ncbi:MAG: ATP-binding protein [Thermodesulfobacteriota bacterium]
MQFYWLPPFLAAILDLILGVFVLWHAPRKRLNQIFALFALSLTSWNFDIAALYFFTDYELALYWSAAFRYGMLLIPPVAYHLALELTGRKTLTTRILLAVGYATAFALCVGNAQGILVQRLERFAWGYYPIGEPLYKFHALSDVVYFTAAIYRVARGFRKSESARQRQQLKLVLFGFAVAGTAGLTNLLPTYGINFFPLGNLGNVFLCGALTYAIVKHGLLDVELIITKTTATAIALLLWLVPLWLLTSSVQQQIYGTSDSRLLLFALAVFVLSGLCFPWLLRVTEAKVRRTFWGQKYDSLQALYLFQKTILHVLDKKKIVEDLRQVLTDTLQTEFVSVYLQQPRAEAYVDSQDDEATFSPQDPFVQAVSRQPEAVVREEVMLREEDPHAAVLATTLARRRGEVCVPLRVQNRLLGFILLGRKRNRDAFSAEDLRLLSTLGTEVAVALENARLYEELRASQVLLARSDRLAAIGTLAAGIAHEIRNPLVAVQTFVQLLPEQLDDAEFRSTFLQLANSELERISTLINDLMTFARPTPATVSEARLNDIVTQVARLFEGQARKRGVTLQISLAPNMPPLLLDPDQMKQVFMNLVLNALQATEAGGTVTLSTAVRHDPNGPDSCEIEVYDTGAGIPAAQQEQIFDPFFTTKETGTGLGLFIVHQIISEHGGSIEVDSTVGQGTRFRIRLPLPPPQVPPTPTGEHSPLEDQRPPSPPQATAQVA